MSRTTDYDIEKVYWTIGEVSVMTGIPPSTIRRWTAGLKVRIGRNGHRYFTKEDIDKIKRT